jgi:hypothetical protein
MSRKTPPNDKHFVEFIENADLALNAPKWISSFRDKYYEKFTIPFLAIYQATAIASNKSSPMYRDKSRALAISISQLQAKNYILPNSNRLSANGDLREIATMRKLGEEKTKSYLKRFENL